MIFDRTAMAAAAPAPVTRICYTYERWITQTASQWTHGTRGRDGRAYYNMGIIEPRA